MALSALLMMGTQQFQQIPPTFSSGMEVPSYTPMSQGETIKSLVAPMAALSWMREVATTMGGVAQFSISRSTPSSWQVWRMLTMELTKLLMLELLANTFCQFPFCPPTEIITFFPCDCQLSTKAVGQLAESIVTLPSGLVLTKAKITNETPGLTSSVLDCPQKLSPKPQQNMDTSKQLEKVKSDTSSRAVNIFIVLNGILMINNLFVQSYSKQCFKQPPYNHSLAGVGDDVVVEGIPVAVPYHEAIQGVVVIRKP